MTWILRKKMKGYLLEIEKEDEYDCTFVPWNKFKFLTGGDIEFLFRELENNIKGNENG